MPVRRMRPDEVEQITPAIVEQTQGVTGGERNLAALAANPDSYRSFLESKGYQTRPYGGAWNFAVRKRDGDPWQVVNPSGPDVGDITSFLSDALATLGVGAISTLGATAGGLAGAPGGPVGIAAGAITGGGMAGAAGEAARQGLGAAAGIPDNVDPTQIGMSGLFGAALPAGGAAIGATGRGVAKVAGGHVGKEIGESLADLGAIVAGIGPLGKSMTGGTVLQKFAEIPPASRTNLKDVAKRLHRVVGKMWNKGDAQIVELTEARALAKQAAEQGVEIDLRAPLEALDDFSPKPGAAVSKTTTRKVLTEAEINAETQSRKAGFRTNFAAEPVESTPFDVGVEQTATGRTSRATTTTRTVTEAADVLGANAAEAAISEPELPRAIQGVVGRIKSLLGDQDPSRVSPVIATKIIRQLQRIAKSKGAYGEIPVGSKFTRLIAEAGHDMRVSTEQAMEAAGFPAYTHLMGIGAERFSYLKNMYEIAGASQDDALRYVKGVYGENFSINSLKDFERNMGGRAARLSTAVERAHVRSAALGPGRVEPRLVPRFTAVGTPLMLASTGMAWVFGGPLGGLASLALASPRSIVGITRLLQKAGGPAALQASPSATSQFVKDAIKVLSMSAAQGTGRRVINEDSSGRRRAVFMGD